MGDREERDIATEFVPERFLNDGVRRVVNCGRRYIGAGD